MKHASLGFGLVAILAACGGAGSSEPTDESAAGGAGASGSGGGASGTGGKAGGTGGSSGVTGKGGSSGASGNGGAAGSSGSAGTSGSAGASGGKGGSAGSSGSAGTGGTTMSCAAGQIICEGFNAKTCDGKGGFTKTDTCPTGCAPDIGCVACPPNSGSCDASGNAKKCKPDGSGYDTSFCDPELDVKCNPMTFQCEGACANLKQSYQGCEYWPTTVANMVWSNFHFAVAVANPAGAAPAKIKITRSGGTVASVTVAPGSLEIIKLPWVKELKGPQADSSGSVPPGDPTKLVAGGAYRLRSNTPVTVYQFNALEYALTSADPDYASCPGLQGFPPQGCFSFSNDASLLLPTNAMTGNYRVFTYPTWDAASIPGYAAIVATTDGTMLTFTSNTQIQAGGGLAALSKGGSGTIMMNAGDVIQVMGKAQGSDISGSLIKATQPVQVIGGTACSNIPSTKGACDHIEETMLPIETLGTEYAVTAPNAPGGNKSYELRVNGIEDGTVITSTPAAPGLGATFTLAAGETKSFGVTTGDFVLSSNSKKFYVSQFMVGQSVAGAGDPSQSNGVPTFQYRTDYTFLAPNSYDQNFVNITAAKGATVMLDGAPVAAAAFAPIGASMYQVARVPLAKTQVHTVLGMNGAKVGIVVYGYGQYTSYMYPGGLDLTRKDL